MENPPQRRDSPTSHLRASDSNRDQVAALLGEALSTGQLSHEEYSERLDSLYQAKTVGELEVLTHDLQVERQRPAASPVSYAPNASTEPDNIIAVFGGADRRGRWRVRRQTKALAVFGGVRFDLTEAEFEAKEVEITINAIFGGAEIILPEGVEVRCQGVGVFGGYDVHNSPDVDPTAPVVVIKGLALFGGVSGRFRRRRDR
ncbi:DUF1707 SHOCT-like domain-containing protein [Microbispora catharanthi]|uniref:DUF1707 domain-containing protein n=1 Tax=Microbispora catharanthi TaxID=1712871 RepID=A0A5N6B224_9ACTN|nr:DUF1707 domain-containing protein [Microbispora catharanthi]KAB8175101.1 DUF1707 domain-containing protein [Microbispora catharanthi]